MINALDPNYSKLGLEYIIIHDILPPIIITLRYPAALTTFCSFGIISDEDSVIGRGDTIDPSFETRADVITLSIGYWDNCKVFWIAFLLADMARRMLMDKFVINDPERTLLW